MVSRCSRARCARRRTLRERSVRRSVGRFERLDALFQGFQLLLRARQKLGLRVEAFTRNQIPLLEIGAQYRAEIVFQLAAQAAQYRRQDTGELGGEVFDPTCFHDDRFHWRAADHYDASVPPTHRAARTPLAPKSPGPAANPPPW